MHAAEAMIPCMPHDIASVFSKGKLCHDSANCADPGTVKLAKSIYLSDFNVSRNYIGGACAPLACLLMQLHKAKQGGQLSTDVTCVYLRRHAARHLAGQHAHDLPGPQQQLFQRSAATSLNRDARNMRTSSPGSCQPYSSHGAVMAFCMTQPTCSVLIYMSA